MRKHGIVRLYVDDMIIAANTSRMRATVKNALRCSFKMKELGTTNFILGIEVSHDSKVGTWQ